MSRPRIDLADTDFATLLDLAARERRTAGDQAAVILERELSRRRTDDTGDGIHGTASQGRRRDVGSEVGR